MSDEDIRVLVHQAVAAIEANSRFLREVARRLDDDSDLPQGGHAHLPGVPCSWCPPRQERQVRVFDQGHEAGMAVPLSTLHFFQGMDMPPDTYERALRLYQRSQQHDPWPGESYEGTSLREFPDLGSPPIEEVNRVNPYGEWDAETWAKAFVEEHGGDVGLMLAWFANALMTGYDEGRRRERQLQEGGDDAQ